MTINRRGAVLRSAFAVTAAAVALAATAGTALASGDPAAAARARAAAVAEHRAQDAPRASALARADEAPVETPTFAMPAVLKRNSNLYLYFPNGEGGFDARYDVGVSFDGIADTVDVDNDKDGWEDGSYTLFKDGRLSYSWITDDLDYHDKQVGTGWHIYRTILSPGSLGGAKEADLIGVDKAGVLWSYLAYPGGSLTPRTRVGSGWDQYTQIAGQGDLTGDGKADIVARDKSGVLWLYKGTGNYKTPFAGRAKIGGGWNAFDRLLSVGDLNMDGRTDLIARKTNGDLLRYSGTGNAAAPFQKPVKIGHGYQIYNLL
ncbi:FG-GAP repeat domain-containing protein [Streptomyces sp. NPDC059247]|uniref:FG-GAP repeat domain-containing protein n=1 Tax=Streptomyces sp. NPDC059247 TaxID=3346790 RepID=UPI003677B845